MLSSRPFKQTRYFYNIGIKLIVTVEKADNSDTHQEEFHRNSDIHSEKEDGLIVYQYVSEKKQTLILV
jgi:hypothetical protein